MIDKLDDNVVASRGRITELLAHHSVVPDAYVAGHLARFAVTMSLLPEASGTGQAALDVGYMDFMLHLLRNDLKYDAVAGTSFSDDEMASSSFIQLDRFQDEFWYRVFAMNLEKHRFDCPDNSFNLVVCGEVIEHMDVDPMFFISELNRIVVPGGHLFLSTPNSTSSRIVSKILRGYRPQFFMQYQKDLSRYRHNFEYDVHGVTSLLHAGGFDIKTIQTSDVFEPPVPEVTEILKNLDMPLDFRGDDILVLAVKSDGVRDRYPSDLYV